MSGYFADPPVTGEVQTPDYYLVDDYMLRSYYAAVNAVKYRFQVAVFPLVAV